jgi:DNA polymerase-3 subunit alpha
VELELKIQKIELFRDIKDKLVDKITLTIPLQQIDDEFADELSTLLLSKKGNVNLYVSVVDENSPNKIKLFSRQHRVKIDTDVYRYIKKAKEAAILDFAINE